MLMEMEHKLQQVPNTSISKKLADICLTNLESLKEGLKTSRDNVIKCQVQQKGIEFTDSKVQALADAAAFIENVGEALTSANGVIPKVAKGSHLQAASSKG